ncbi:MAG: Flp family type IVb pilin [Pseudomonadota bacterium]|nr:Flp family type IVb pilin [Pseudomonadota bacterium]
MNKFLSNVNTSIQSFAQDEEGAQVVEYALIIAVVSIALVAAIGALVKDASFTGFIGRVKTCLTAGSTCV